MRTALVALVAALTTVLPASAARADESDCPQAVLDVRGTNPSLASVGTAIADAASTYDVPPRVLKAIAYQESGVRQYEADGSPVISSDAVCGVGMMQVTADDYPEADAVRLASDYAYNVSEGARILREKWDFSQQTPPPAGEDPDDPDVIENWFYAICLYNGCGSDPTYPTRVAEIVADPFRRVAPAMRTWMRLGWFTKPQDADPSYEFPSAFQAQRTPTQRFLFYDHTTGIVSKEVAAPTHGVLDTYPAQATYEAGAYGPDGPRVDCEIACGGWRLAEGVGKAGRAHWTNSVAGSTDATRVRWSPSLPRAGSYRVSAYVPNVPGTLGTARYVVAGTEVVVDQNAVKGKWVSLGTRSLVPGNTVALGDASSVGGQRLYADAVKFTPAPKLVLSASPTTVTYSVQTNVRAKVTHSGTNVPLGGQKVLLYRSYGPSSGWLLIGEMATRPDGIADFVHFPTSNAQYTARIVATSAQTQSAASGDVPVSVRPLVRASLSQTSVPRNTAVTVSVKVNPPHPGQRVVLQRWYDGAWRDSLGATLSSTGTATFRFAKSVPGTYQYRVYKAADADHVKAASATMTLKVT